jgi:hypothetical protein
MVAAVAFTALTQPPHRVVLQPDAATTDLVDALVAEQWRVDVVADAQAEVREGRAWAGLAPGILYTTGSQRSALLAESAIRDHVGTSWRYDLAETRLKTVHRDSAAKWGMLRAFGVLYALYGVVLGVGSVVRDRDEGLLEPELALGVPLWVHPMARWLSCSLMLGIYFVITVGLFHAAVGVAGPLDIARHGVAASSAAAAIGVAVSSWVDRRRSFASSLTLGLALTSMLSAFSMNQRIGDYVPVASLISPFATGEAAILSSVMIGLLATQWVTRRELCG